MSNALPYKVSVVLDRSFGDRLGTLAQNGPVWIVDSPANNAAALTCWKANPTRNHLDGITVFGTSVTTSAEDTLIGNLETIDLHHGEHSAPVPCSVLDVIGTPKTSKIEAAFAEYGFDQFENTTYGFRSTRNISPSDL